LSLGECCSQCLGDAKVSHHDIASLVTDDVAGLQIAMYEFATVSIIESISKLHNYLFH
jgi:hypothetical protein